MRQIATALYFIDILALRAGHEKDEEEADTVGCCNLKVRLPPLPPACDADRAATMPLSAIGSLPWWPARVVDLQPN